MIISPNQILAAEESRLLASTREPVTSSAASERLRETAGDTPAEWYETTSYHADEAGEVYLGATLDRWAEWWERHFLQAVLVLWVAFWMFVLAGLLYPLFAAVIGGAR